MILQDNIPYDVGRQRPLPGIAPASMDDWLQVDSAYAGQMACRCQLLESRRDDVVFLSESAMPAACELLDIALAHRPEQIGRAGDTVLCPDGRTIALARHDPLGTLGLIFQEDFCILQQQGREHVLTAAVLCFPASWRLSEKAGRPLTAIHSPVAPYDAALARRVQRLFDGVKPGRPLWRFNALWYEDPTLHQPRSEKDPRDLSEPGAAEFLRSERQCILRLPQSNAVVFSIHTYVQHRSQVDVSREVTSVRV